MGKEKYDTFLDVLTQFRCKECVASHARWPSRAPFDAALSLLFGLDIHF